MTKKKAKEADEEADEEPNEEAEEKSIAKERQRKKREAKRRKEKRKAEELASKEKVKELAKEMLGSGMGISEVIEKTGLPSNTISGLQSYLIREEKVKRLLREGKSIEEIAKDAKIPKAMIKSIAKTIHIKPPEKAKIPEERPEEDENMLSVKLDDEERELLEKGKNTMLAFQDAGIIPRKLRDDSDEEFMRLASLSLASAMATVQEQARGGK